jgi:putative methionine-R-sulfoxide reductase with GAF domain
MMPARLTIYYPSAPAQVLALPEGRQAIVGRDPECDVVLADDRVSRRHAALLSNAFGWTVTDLASKNGTLVDGVPFATGVLEERSWISFGGLLTYFESRPAEPLSDERLRRLTTALETQRGLVPQVGLAALLERVVASMLALANAERGFLLLARPDGELEVAARVGLSWEDLKAVEFGGSVGAVERALTSGRPVVSADVRADAELGERASVVAGGIRALVAVPVRALDRLIGAMYADSRKPGAAFTELDLEILEALATQAGLAIAVARLDDEIRGLAKRIAHEAGADAELRVRIAGEVAELRERSLPAARPGAPARQPESSLSDTWYGLVAAHAPLGVGS